MSAWLDNEGLRLLLQDGERMQDEGRALMDRGVEQAAAAGNELRRRGLTA